MISLGKRQTIKTFKLSLNSQRVHVFALFIVIVFIIPIISSINQSKFSKIQTKSSLFGPNQQNALQAQQTQISLHIDPYKQQRL